MVTANESRSLRISMQPAVIVMCVMSLAVFSGTASAAAPPCAAGTLASYKALGSGGCTHGNYLFSNFAYHNGNEGSAVKISEDGIAVVPIAGGKPALAFAAAWTAGPGQALFSLIIYKVTALSATEPIQVIATRMKGFGHTGDGLVTVTETLPSGVQLLLHDNGDTKSSDSLSLSPGTAGPLLIITDIEARGGTHGLGTVSWVENWFAALEDAPAPTLGAPACPSAGSFGLDRLLPGGDLSGGCTIGGLYFGDFSYTGSGSGGAAAIPASGISVSKLETTNDPGLLISAPWAVGRGQTLDSLVRYQVAALPGGCPVQGIGAGMAGYSQSGGGTVAVAETTSLGNILLFDNASIVDSGEVQFAPTTSPIEVVKDISVNGNLDGTGAVSQVINRFMLSASSPTITELIAQPNILWPPTKKMVPVKLSGATAGGCGTVSCEIISVSSNEPPNSNALATGDAVKTGNLALTLRSDRKGDGSGRIYTISVRCTDGQNNNTIKTTTVTVPHDERK